MDNLKDQALQEEIICPLCFCVYNNPLSLQCLHSYCEECLFQLHQSKQFADSLICPECRAETVLGEEGIHGLKSNFKLNRIVEIISVEEKREIAKNSSSRRPPIPLPRASPYHARKPPPLPEKPAPPCVAHVDKPLEFYCTQCKVLICSMCMLDSHRFHKEPISAKEALQDRILALKNTDAQVESVLAKAGETVGKLQSEIDGLWESADSDVRIAQEYFQRLRTLLDRRELEVCKSIETRATQHQKRFDKQKKMVATSIDDLRKTRAVVSDIIEHRSTDINVLLSERSTTQKLETQMQYVTTVIEKAKEKSRTSYKSPFSPDPEFEAKCKVVGIPTEPLTPTIQPRLHTFVHSPNTRPRSSELKSRDSDYELSTSAPESSPTLQQMKERLHTAHLKSVGSRPIKKNPVPDSQAVLSLNPHSDDANLQIPCVIINSSSLLGPTHHKAVAASPCGVCVGSSHTLVVTDSKNHMLSILTPTGKFLHSVETEGKSDGQFLEPVAVLYDIKGRIMALDKGQPPRVQLFSESGNYVSKFKVRSLAYSCYLGEPLGLAEIDHKTYLVSDSEKSCVHIFDDEGKYQGKFGDTEMRTKQPAGMTLDNRGNVYITDRGNHCVWIYTCGGQYVSRVGKHGSAPGELNYPFGIAVDQHNNYIYVSESVNHRISVFSPGGKFLRFFGKKGSEPGMFHTPRHLCMDSQGRLVVADENNQRLQIFDISD